MILWRPSGWVNIPLLLYRSTARHYSDCVAQDKLGESGCRSSRSEVYLNGDDAVSDQYEPVIDDKLTLRIDCSILEVVY